MGRAGGALRFFHDVKSQSERIHWIGGPTFFPFILNGVWWLLFGLAWGAISLFLFFDLRPKPTGIALFGIIGFHLVHMAPLWLSMLNLARLVYVHRNTFYAVTDRRIILRHGFLRIGQKSIDHDKIADIEMYVGPIHKLLGCGTILIHPRLRTSDSTEVDQDPWTTERFVSVRRPKYVFEKLTQMVADSEIDWYQPNRFRQEEKPLGLRDLLNPGLD